MNVIIICIIQVMHSWLEYTKYRKRRLKLYDEAMAYYRKTLLDTGITEWIKVCKTASFIYIYIYIMFNFRLQHGKLLKDKRGHLRNKLKCVNMYHVIIL